ncbi:MAG: hypothetical protein RIS47_397, partial [Bacteroidota bacterium]
MRIRLTILALFLFISSIVTAQSGSFTLRGIVLFDRKVQPNSVVRIYKEQTKVDSTISAANGKFSITMPLNQKYLVQFVGQGKALKNISIETVLPSSLQMLDYNKYMVITLESSNTSDSNSQVPVAQFKFNANGELYEAGYQYVEVPKVKGNNVPETKLSNIQDDHELQKRVKAAEDQINRMMAQARRELDSARREAYRINTEAAQKYKEIAGGKPKVVSIHDTIYIEKKTTSNLLAEKNKETQRINQLQIEIGKRISELDVRKQDLLIQRLNARTQEDSMKIAEIDQSIRFAETEIGKLRADIETAEEKIRYKDLQIKTRNRALIYSGLIAFLILSITIIIYRNYKAKRQMAYQLALKNTELQELSTIVSQTDNAVVLFDKEGNLEWVNKGFSRMYGYKFEDLESFKLDNIFLRKDKEESSHQFEQVLQKGIQVSFESSTPHKDGRQVWAQTTMTPIVDSHGQLHKIAAIDSNITDIKTAQDEIKIQKEKLELHNRMIQDSIKYAHTIQEAFLPPMRELNLLFENFVINIPKDIVSGDFIWYNRIRKQSSELFFVAAVDCTGHGVPGAFMSMIGSRLLTEITGIFGITDPAEILDRLDIEVRKALKQDTTENTDGMDVCLCVLEKTGQGIYKLQYAGAQRPLL